MNKRLQKELNELNLKFFKSVKIDDANMNRIEGLLIPDSAPYKKGAFRVEILFPTEYPFKPPKITFRTKIYHPNIDENGQICLPIIDNTNWKPSTRISAVLESLLALVNCPEPDHPLRQDVAQQFLHEKSRFKKTAEEYTLKYSEKLE